MKTLIYLSLIVLIGCSSVKYRTAAKSDFIVLFGSGFNKDTVSLGINNTPIFENKILQSDTVLGVVRSISITQSAGKLSVLGPDNKSERSIEMPSSEVLNITVVVNRESHLLTASLKKGYIIMVNNQPFYKKVTITQSKKTISLD